MVAKGDGKRYAGRRYGRNDIADAFTGVAVDKVACEHHKVGSFGADGFLQMGDYRVAPAVAVDIMEVGDLQDMESAVGPEF